MASTLPCNIEVPVVYALSRRQLGRAIMKNVTVSVLAIEDVRGAQDSFKRMLKEAAAVRDTPRGQKSWIGGAKCVAVVDKSVQLS